MVQYMDPSFPNSLVYQMDQWVDAELLSKHSLEYNKEKKMFVLLNKYNPNYAFSNSKIYTNIKKKNHLPMDE